MQHQRLSLVHRPTPLWRNARLDALVSAEVWVKRDDMTAGAEAGNKIRKLEYLLAAAQSEGADIVLTCGAAQSNHARATALLARSLGMDSLLFLRVPNPSNPPQNRGNLFLDRMAAAEVRFITPLEYEDNRGLMRAAASDLRRQGRTPYVIVEGGSSGLGALGYVDAMQEVRAQLDGGIVGAVSRFDSVVHACGSGGTAAGIALGCALTGVAPRTDVVAVCDDGAHFRRVIDDITAECRALEPDLPPPVPSTVHDDYKGPAYGVADQEQRAFILQIASETGLILDPVYTGKAMWGLARLQLRQRVLFVHTGGLPGLLADCEALSPCP